LRLLCPGFSKALQKKQMVNYFPFGLSFIKCSITVRWAFLDSASRLSRARSAPRNYFQRVAPHHLYWRHRKLYSNADWIIMPFMPWKNFDQNYL
jgi:hypothetical protein